MYAIIAQDGRQLRVQEGDELQIDFRGGKPGDELTFDRVLACGGEAGLRLGAPTLAGATVTARVMGVVQGEKLTVQKMRRRKNFRRRTGHRQVFTRVRINKIQVP